MNSWKNYLIWAITLWAITLLLTLLVLAVMRVGA